MSRQNEGLRLHRWDGRLHSERWTIADPGPGEVQVAVEACGVGATVLNNARGENWNDPALLPRVPGHEVVGHVVRVGDGVATPAVGDRILAYFYLSCFDCSQCAAGREQRCERLAGRYGIHRDGGYARLSNLPAGNAIALPLAIDAAQATVIPDAVATPVHVCRSRLRLRAGERLVVIGAAGGVGAHLVQVARAEGADVVGIDRTVDKLALVAALGAEPVDGANLSEARLRSWGGTAEAVVDLVGSAATLSWAIDHLAQGGRLCVLTMGRDLAVPARVRELVARELSIVGSRYASRKEVAEAARLVGEGRVRPIVGATAAADRVEDLHAALRDGTLLGRGALVW